MSKPAFRWLLAAVWLPWLFWSGVGIAVGGWSMSAKLVQTDRLSRAIERGVINVQPLIDSGLEPSTDDPLDIALNRLAINPSGASRMLSYAVGCHGAINILTTIVLLVRRHKAGNARV